MPLTRTSTPHLRALALALCLAMGPGLPAAFGSPSHARAPITWKAASGIEITPELRRHIARVAEIYYAKTRRPLEITSGYRSPRRQADALYTKLAVGGSLAIYNNQALTQPLNKAFREGRKKRWKRDRIVAAMAAVLEAQVAEGHYLSRHMRGLAFDVRSTGMSGRQRQAFLAAVREAGDMRVIHESRPPHYHVEILKPDGVDTRRSPQPTRTRAADSASDPNDPEPVIDAPAGAPVTPPRPLEDPARPDQPTDRVEAQP